MGRIRCSEEIENRVLRLAEGSLEDSNEEKKIKRHLLICRSCRDLFAECQLFHSIVDDFDMDPQKASGMIIEIGIDEGNNMLYSVNEGNSQLVSPVNCLSDGPSETLSYEVMLDDVKSFISVIRIDDDIDFEIRSTKEQSEFSLVGLSKTWVSTLSGGIVNFSVVAPEGGDFILSENGRAFIIISLKKQN